jgi:hypothetical protein
MGGMMTDKDEKIIEIVLNSDEYELLTVLAECYLPELNEVRDAGNLATILIRQALERVKGALVSKNNLQ